MSRFSGCVSAIHFLRFLSVGEALLRRLINFFGSVYNTCVFRYKVYVQSLVQYVCGAIQKARRT